jgi:hypothetical protein
MDSLKPVVEEANRTEGWEEGYMHSSVSRAADAPVYWSQ